MRPEALLEVPRPQHARRAGSAVRVTNAMFDPGLSPSLVYVLDALHVVVVVAFNGIGRYSQIDRSLNARVRSTCLQTTRASHNHESCGTRLRRV